MSSLKLYAGLALILLLGFAFWYVHKLSYDSGVNAERTKWQSQVIALTKERDKLRETAETLIVDKRPVWNERKEKARQVSADCSLPAVHISVLRESGIFVAPSG